MLGYRCVNVSVLFDHVGFWITGVAAGISASAEINSASVSVGKQDEKLESKTSDSARPDSTVELTTSSE